MAGLGGPVKKAFDIQRKIQVGPRGGEGKGGKLCACELVLVGMGWWVCWYGCGCGCGGGGRARGGGCDGVPFLLGYAFPNLILHLHPLLHPSRLPRQLLYLDDEIRVALFLPTEGLTDTEAEEVRAAGCACVWAQGGAAL